MIAKMRALAAPLPTFDHFSEDQPFNLVTCLGAHDFADICKWFKEPWDGNVSSFSSFVVKLRLREAEGKCDAQAPNGILIIGGNNLLTNYHSITDTEIKTVRTNRADNWAIQNSRAMFACIKASINGDPLDTIFGQSAKKPTHTDGQELFKHLTAFTTVATLQLSLLSFTRILEFNPSNYKFNIVEINSWLMHLFVLATT